MAYIVPGDFGALENRGSQVFAQGLRMGKQGEIADLIERAHHLWAGVCRRRLLSLRPTDAYSASGSPVTVLEGLAKIGTARYGYASALVDVLEVYFDWEGGSVDVEVYDNTFTTLHQTVSSGTSTPRAQVSGAIPDIPDQEVGLRVILTPGVGTGKLYGVEVWEAAIPAASLTASGDFIPLDETAYDDGASYHAMLSKRIAENTFAANETRTAEAVEVVPRAAPLTLTSLTEMVAERVIPLSPEMAQVTVTLWYLCEEASVQVRWSLAWDGGQGEPSAWETITTTGGAYAKYTKTLSLRAALEAGKGSARLRLHYISAQNTGGKVYGPLAGSTTLGARKVNLALALTSYWAGADAVSGAKVDFETGGGVAVDSSGDGVRQMLRWESGSPYGLYFYPPVPDAEVSALSVSVGRLAITPLGRLRVRSWGVEFIHGTPYAGRGPRFPWEDPQTAWYALTTGRGLVGPSFQSLYLAQEALFLGRVPIYGWGAQPWTRPSGYAELRGHGFVQLTFGAISTWKTLASWVVGEGDSYILGGSPMTRRALEMIAQMFCTGWFIEGFRVEARLVWATEGGTTWATGASQAVDLDVAPVSSFIREVFTEPDGASYPGAKYVKALGCGLPAQEWARMSYFKATLRDLVAGHTAGRVLRLEVRPAQDLQEGDFGHKHGVFVYYNSGFVRPMPYQPWAQLGV